MYTACIDIGGTFTDLVLYSRESDLEIFKSPTTPGEFEKGFINVLVTWSESKMVMAIAISTIHQFLGW